MSAEFFNKMRDAKSEGYNGSDFTAGDGESPTTKAILQGKYNDGQQVRLREQESLNSPQSHPEYSNDTWDNVKERIREHPFVILIGIFAMIMAVVFAFEVHWILGLLTIVFFGVMGFKIRSSYNK